MNCDKVSLENASPITTSVLKEKGVSRGGCMFRIKVVLSVDLKLFSKSRPAKMEGIG